MSSGLLIFTIVHVIISLVGIGSGFVVIYGFLTAQRLDRWTAVFLASYAARILAMKRSSSARRRVLSLDNVRAECSTFSEAEPVSVAPRLTCMMLAAASCVPWATF